MSLVFKNFMIANFNLKKTSLAVVLVYSLLLAFLFESQSSKPFVILGVTFIGYFIFFDSKLIINYTDLIHRYKNREIFLLPLSKKELFVLILIESFIVTWVISFGLIIFLRINELGLGDSYWNWKFLTPLVLVLGVFIIFSNSLRYNFTEIAKKYQWYLFVKNTIFLITSISFVALMLGLIKFKHQDYRELVLIFLPIACVLYMSIWLFLNFKSSFFNEHISFKRLFFSPLQDLSVILCWLVVGILYVKFNFSLF